MSKNKLKKFSELEHLQRVIQPDFKEIFDKDHELKGRWSEQVFENAHPIVLELGCGKGEYTLALAEQDPGRNFIGVDIKGARIWSGAKTANERNMLNVAFLRTRIEFIRSFFASGEVDEIWITFPDPQLKRRRNKKRLTGSLFLNSYRAFLKDNGLIHLKTDNDVLFNYTRETARFNNLEIVKETSDVYNSDLSDEILSVKTYYEKRFLEEGSNINYICFSLPSDTILKELPEHGE